MHNRQFFWCLIKYLMPDYLRRHCGTLLTANLNGFSMNHSEGAVSLFIFRGTETFTFGRNFYSWFEVNFIDWCSVIPNRYCIKCIDDLIFGTFNRFYLVNISVCPYKTEHIRVLGWHINLKTLLRSRALSRFDLFIFLLCKSPFASTLIGGLVRSLQQFMFLYLIV